MTTKASEPLDALPRVSRAVKLTTARTTCSIGACILALCLALCVLFLATQRTALAWMDFEHSVSSSDGNSRKGLSDHDRRDSALCSGDANDAIFEAAPLKSVIGGPCFEIGRLANFTAALRRRQADDVASSASNLTSNNSSNNSSSSSSTCARSFKLPRSGVITEQGAARVWCTSSFANAVRYRRGSGCGFDSGGGGLTRDRATTSSLPTRPFEAPPPAPDARPGASICVFYLNYRNLDNLATSVLTHTMRSLHPDVVSHTVLTMDEDVADVDATRQRLGAAADVHRLVFPPGTRGGDPLPLALRLISLLSSCPITVVSDSDAFMLRDGWDQRLLTAFLDPQLTLFASNPRHQSHGEAFRDVAEWNWMAYRTRALAGVVIGGGRVQHADVGHYYTSCVDTSTERRVHLQGTAWPYKGKAATVVTDSDGAPWILHMFYASRHANEPDEIKAEARKYSLTEEQLRELRFNLTRTRCFDPQAAFGRVGLER